MTDCTVDGSKLLSQVCGKVSNIASSFWVVWNKRTSALNLMHALAALNKVPTMKVN